MIFSMRTIIHSGIRRWGARLSTSLWLVLSLNGRAQTSLPPAYGDLQSDTARMFFLMHAIEDSLNEAQLSHVIDWAREGLQLARKNNNDTLKGIFLFDIGKAFTYHFNIYDSAIFYYKQVLPYFPDKLRKYNVLSVREIMDRYSDLGNKDSSFAYLDQLRALIDTMPPNSPKRATLSQNIASVYEYFGMYRSAIRYFQVAINGSRAIGNQRGLGLSLANLGELYSQMEDFDKAISTSKEALLYLADVNMPFMQTAANLADYYITLRQYDSAARYIAISNKVVEKINAAENRITNQAIEARIFMARRQYDKAKALLDNTIGALEKTDNSWMLCKALMNYADLDSSLGNTGDAKKRLLEVVSIAGKNHFEPFSVVALQKLAAMAARAGDYRSAFDYQQQFQVLRDSMISSRARTDLNDLEISYQTQQNEQKIRILEKDNEIKTLQVSNARRTRVFYLGGVVAFLLIAWLVYYYRDKRIKAQAQRVQAELETQILRSQMNPHFIFNSLNSIENFIMQNEKRLASDYLNKFSKLIRSILDSSRDEVVPVAKDMEVLKLYTDLEQLRFNNKFTCEIDTDPALVQGPYQVPSLLIQPYVENAIVHGIAHSEKDRLLITVSAKLEGDHIRYVIQDNGVGRALAAGYNRQNKPGHRSVGLQITAERIARFNQEEGTSAVKVIDLYDDNHQPCGTKVEIILNAV